MWRLLSSDTTVATLNVKAAVIRHHQSWLQTWTLLSSDTTITKLNVKTAVIRHHQSWHQMQTLLSSDTTTTNLNVKTAVIRHHQSWYQMRTLLSSDITITKLNAKSDTTVGISSRINKNASLICGISYDILIFPTSAWMTSHEWNHIWSASTQTVWTKENWKK